MWLTIRMARYIFMRSKNMPSSQYCIIYSPLFGWSAPLYSPPKRCEQHQPKTGCVDQVLGKPPLIAGASTTICTRYISRAAPLCTNLDGNLCPTLTAHPEPLPSSELAETGSRQIIHISIRWRWICIAFFLSLFLKTQANHLVGGHHWSLGTTFLGNSRGRLIMGIG